MTIPFPSSSLQLHSIEDTDTDEHNSHQGEENQETDLMDVNQETKVKPKIDYVANRDLPSLLSTVEEVRTYHEAYLQLGL